MLRLHLDDGGRLRIDRAGPGRGAWICLATPLVCLETAISRKALDRAMRRSVDRASIDSVVAELTARPGQDVVSSA